MIGPALPRLLIPFAMAAMSIGCTVEPIPPERMYQADFCLDHSRWDAVETYTRKFGEQHGFEYEGTRFPADENVGEMLNIGILRGRHLLGGSDFLLSIVSDPFDGRKGDFAAITHRKMTQAERALALRFLEGLKPVACVRGGAAVTKR